MKIPHIVDNSIPNPTKKPLRKVIAKKISLYLFMKLDEQLVLALVHAGYEAVVSKNQIFLRYKGPEHEFRMWINQHKIRFISILIASIQKGE